MCKPRHVASSTFRRHQLARSIEVYGAVAMRPCSSCVASGIECKVSASARSCLRCTQKSTSCDLSPFSPAKWQRIQRKRKEKYLEVKAARQKEQEARAAEQEAQARLHRLESELYALEEKSLNMVDNEENNIVDQELEEALAGFDPNDFPFDTSTEQIDSLLDFSVAPSANPQVATSAQDAPGAS